MSNGTPTTPVVTSITNAVKTGSRTTEFALILLWVILTVLDGQGVLYLGKDMLDNMFWLVVLYGGARSGLKVIEQFAGSKLGIKINGGGPQ